MVNIGGKKLKLAIWDTGETFFLFYCFERSMNLLPSNLISVTSNEKCLSLTNWCFSLVKLN